MQWLPRTRALSKATTPKRVGDKARHSAGPKKDDKNVYKILQDIVDGNGRKVFSLCRRQSNGRCRPVVWLTLGGGGGVVVVPAKCPDGISV